MQSIWTQDIKKPCFEELKQNAKTDVLIIGGGITGLLCAYMLKKSGVDCIVAEADKICSGTTKNTTAKITFAHGLIYDKMIKRFGEDFAGLYLNVQREALLKYKNMAKEIPCDFEEQDSFIYSKNNRKIIEKEILALEKIGFKADFTDNLPLPFKTMGAVRIKNQAQFHPLKFAFSIAKDLNIYENTNVLKIRPGGAVTNHGKIKAKKIIVASHFPFINSHGGYFLKMYQHRSYVLALENAPVLDGMYVDEAKDGLSFRSFDNLLLLGGGSHRTGKTGGGWQELSSFAKKHYSVARQVCRWATQDCMTLDNIPYIGQYSKNTPTIFVATGFNKWGMTSAMTAATILCDMVLEKENKYSAVFSPARSMMRPQLAVNIFESLKGILTPTVPRCTHLGCALKYNPSEHSWDCSCHGSRFTEEGKLIDNPAKKDIKK